MVVFFNFTPIALLVLLFILSIITIVKKNWFYFYVGISAIAVYIQVCIFVSTLFVDVIGENVIVYSNLPHQDFWEFVTISIYFYAFLGLIGLMVSGVRKLLKLDSKLLFRISFGVFLFGLVLHLFIKQLPCNYSPTKQCVKDEEYFVPSVPTSYIR